MTIRKIFFALLFVFLIIFAIPAMMILFGVYDIKGFFRRPPRALAETMRCDYNIRNEKNENTMRFTTTIKTNNMEDSIAELQIGFYYQNGSPVLSRLDSRPLEIRQQIKVPRGTDGSLTEVASVKYEEFPEECANVELKCVEYLNYKDWKGRMKQHEQCYVEVVVPRENITPSVVAKNYQPLPINHQFFSENVQDSKANPNENGESSINITSMDFNAEGQNGEAGIRVYSKAVLAGGKHYYRVNFFFFDENGPLKDNNELYNIDEYVGIKVQLGELDIPQGQKYEKEIEFFFPYSELHVKEYGYIKLATAARLIQDDKEIVANSPAFYFFVNHTK